MVDKVWVLSADKSSSVAGISICSRAHTYTPKHKMLLPFRAEQSPVTETEMWDMEVEGTYCVWMLETVREREMKKEAKRKE